MTEKQQNILTSGLELFASEGYNNISTSKIARHAGVSEGLIFRHFENKEGLLNAILAQGAETAAAYYSTIVLESDPKTAIRKAIELPMSIPREELNYWRLIYRLKWQQFNYGAEMAEPLRSALIIAFQELEYSMPEAEADLVLAYIDGMATTVLLHPERNADQIAASMINKYSL
ncbi:MAG: helix-turn-helix transcriptional regulator [Bacteroidetes bacterium]|nr:helix-turn-helix transcriptional regulator [Bacteroidota bacterium]